MADELEIPKWVLDAIRSLSDEQLAKYIRDVSDYSYPKAMMTLKGFMSEKEKTDG